MPLTGNDIIDLKEDGVLGKSKDSRFKERVFTPSEQDIIEQSPNKDLMLWSFWASKEAAFKIVSKSIPDTLFSHKNFTITLLGPYSISSEGFNICSTAQYNNLSMPIQIIGNKTFIHAIGHCGTSSPLLHWSTFSTSDSSIHKNQSETVRHHCILDIAKKLNTDPKLLQIKRPLRANRPGPPRLLINGQISKVDISLSHHGEWIAWSFIVNS